jgi:Protein of unknown function (DUF2567)
VTEQPEGAQPEIPGIGQPAPARPGPSGAADKARMRATIVVILGLSAIGVVIGGLWALIAPAIHAVVAITRAGDRVHDYLGTESQHFFVAPTLMLGLLGVVGVVASVLVWQWRAHRGPAMVGALTVGLIGAAAVAAGVGTGLVRLRYGALNFDAVPLPGEHAIAYVVQAPPVFFSHGLWQVLATLVLPAGTAALVYAVLAAASARDDLGALPADGQGTGARPVAPEPSVP